MSNTSIVVCGNFFDIGCRVVLWNEPNGLNAYDVSTYHVKTEDRKTGKIKTVVISGKRYSKRSIIDPNLVKLQGMISQFFLHHSGLYHSKTTFNVLHKERGLSCHFILDDDGTLYQTLDIKEKAWHGGDCNTVSIGVEIDSKAHAGRFPNAYDEYHQKSNNVGPRNKRVDYVQNMKLVGYEYTEAQYETLIKLGIALSKIFPVIGSNLKFPTDSDGNIIKKKIPNAKAHLGLICHYNQSENKNDPISFDHNRLILGIKNNDSKQASTFKDSSNDVSNIIIPDVGPLDSSSSVIGISEILLDPSDSIFDAVIPEYPQNANEWKVVQKVLNKLGMNAGQEDGIPGKKTIIAIKKLQSVTKTSIDGIWGPKTKQKAEELLAGFK